MTVSKRLGGVGLAVLACLGTGGNLPACGDKFLVASRGTRYQRAPVSRRPAAILIFSRSGLFEPGTPGADQVDGILRKSGYMPTVVTTPGEFERALSRGGWDLVVMGGEEASAAGRRLIGHTAVLPVLVNPSEAEWKQIRKEFRVALRAPARSQKVLDAVDEALASHGGSKSKKPQPAI